MFQRKHYIKKWQERTEHNELFVLKIHENKYVIIFWDSCDAIFIKERLNFFDNNFKIM